MLPDVVQVHHYLATLVDGTAVLLNACLLYLILNHSTFHMKVYKQILLVTCVGDLLLSTIVLFGQPVSYFGEWNMHAHKIYSSVHHLRF